MFNNCWFFIHTDPFFPSLIHVLIRSSPHSNLEHATYEIGGGNDDCVQALFYLVSTSPLQLFLFTVIGFRYYASVVSVSLGDRICVERIYRDYISIRIT